MRVAIIGTGLVGGSLGMALRELDEVDSVVGYDRDPTTAGRAVERGALDAVAASAADACRGADLVVVATPVNAIVPAVQEALPGVEPGTLLTDVGSTKARVSIETAAILAAKPGVSFIGGHPMAGSEHDGIEAARPDLFSGAWWVLTPAENTDANLFQKLHRVLSAIGARVMALEPQRHDELMAVISHLPQVTATALMNLAAQKGKEHGGLLALAAGGFRDVTRVAASNPDLWVEICLENREALASELDEFAQRLMDLKSYLKVGDSAALRQELTTASDARRRLGQKAVTGELYEVTVEIPDRPGVLADVTRVVGEQGINIEDLAIAHAAEGGRGSLRLTIIGEIESTKVQDVLSSQGYITMKAQL